MLYPWFFFNTEQVMFRCYGTYLLKEWFWNQILSMELNDEQSLLKLYNSLFTVEVQHTQSADSSTLSGGWGSDMLVLYFILGLLILHTGCGWRLLKTVKNSLDNPQRLEDWWWWQRLTSLLNLATYMNLWTCFACFKSRGIHFKVVVLWKT